MTINFLSTTDPALKKVANSLVGEPDYFQNFQRIGEGSGRIVYRRGNLVIKRAKNIASGVRQNKAEHEIWSMGRHQSILCNLRAISDDGAILIMSYAPMVTEQEFRKKGLGIGRDNKFGKGARGLIARYKARKKLKHTGNDYDKHTSWGMAQNGRPVLIDYAIW